MGFTLDITWAINENTAVGFKLSQQSLVFQVRLCLDRCYLPLPITKSSESHTRITETTALSNYYLIMRVYANLNQTPLCGNMLRHICKIPLFFFSMLLFFFRKGHNACMTSTKAQKLERDGRSRSHLCFSPRAAWWEMHNKRIHPVRTNLLSGSWTSSYLMREDIIAHRCCCADALVGPRDASKFNRCRHRCVLQLSRDENAHLHAQHFIDRDGRLSAIYCKYTGAK